MKARFFRWTSWLPSAALIGAAIWCAADAARAREDQPNCTCPLSLGAPVTPAPMPSCFVSMTFTFAPSNDGTCHTGQCNAMTAVPCRYYFGMEVTGGNNGEKCCVTFKCGVPGSYHVWTDTCTDFFSTGTHNLNQLTCGRDRFYRLFIDNAPGGCSSTWCEENPWVSCPLCDTQVWYVRVKCDQGPDC